MLKSACIVLLGISMLAAYDGMENAHALHITSEGVAMIGADMIHPEYTGRNVKVGIFGGNFDANNAEISGNISQYVGFEDIAHDMAEMSSRDDTSHIMPVLDASAGTAAAEIVVDVAPDAQLYLYDIRIGTDFERAMKHAIVNDLDIILCLITLYNDAGPTDGTSFLSMQATISRENGILWVSPAGDMAKRHWHGDWRNKDGSETYGPYHYFVDPSNPGRGDESTLILDGVNPTDTVWAILSWSQPSTIHGMALYNDWTEVSHIYEIQRNADPSTRLEHTFGGAASHDMTHGASPGVTHGVKNGTAIIDPAIEVFWDDVLSGESVPAELRITLSHDIAYPGYRVAGSSLLVPGDSRDSLTVGAIKLDGTSEPSSSQGPTQDGRTKPDVMAPSGVATASRVHFNGTIPAAAHVAGMAAILAEKFPGILPDMLHTLIQATTAHMQETNHGGTGVASLSGFSGDVVMFGTKDCTACFYPGYVSIPAGDTITWSNVSGSDVIIHIDGDSLAIPNGGTASRMFHTDGMYGYHDRDSGNGGSILVGTANDEPPRIESARIISHNAVQIRFSEPVLADASDFHTIRLTPSELWVPRSVDGSGSDVITIRFDGKPAHSTAYARIMVGPGVTDLTGVPFPGMDIVVSDGQPPSVVLASLTGPNEITIQFDDHATVSEFEIWLMGQPRTPTDMTGDSTDTMVITFAGGPVASLGTGSLVMYGLSDRHGNTADHTGKITDGQPPTLGTVEFVSADTKGRYNPGDTLLLRMEPTERIKNVSVSLNGEQINATENMHSWVWTAEKTITHMDIEGTIQFTINFEDVAGNSADTVTQVTAGTIPRIAGANGTQPVTPMLDLNKGITSARITGGTTLQITFAEPVMAEPDLFSNLWITSEEHPRDVTGLSGSGTRTLTITFAGQDVSTAATAAIDIAPGIRTDDTSYNGVTRYDILDGQPPMVKHVGIDIMEYDTAQPGMILLEFSFSEPVLTPIVTMNGNNATPHSTNDTYTHWISSREISTDEPQGTVEFSIEYSDAIGNTGTTDKTTDGSTGIIGTQPMPVSCEKDQTWNPDTETCEDTTGPHDRPKAVISGVVFLDHSWNGVMDHGERGIAGYQSMIAIDMRNPTNLQLNSTAPDGSYAFEVPADSATLVQTSYLPQNHVVYDPNVSWFTHVVEPAAGSHTIFNVGFHNVTESELAELQIRTFVDLNGNMQRDAGERGVQGLGGPDAPTFHVYTYMIGPVAYPDMGMDGTATVRVVPSDFALLVDVQALERLGYYWTSTSYERTDGHAGKAYDTTYPVADDPEPGSIHTMDVGLSPR